MIKHYIVVTFNNREIALIAYLLIFFLWMVTQKKIRSSVLNIIKAFANKHILLSVLALIIYVGLIVYGLQSFRLWDFSMLKDSIYWTFGVGFILMMNSDKAIKEEGYFKKLLKENFKLVLIIVFILGLYVFGLIAEFILMPFVIFFALMLAYSETYEEYSQVTNFLQNLLGILGIGYLIYSGYRIFKDINEFASFDTLKSFLFPIIMMLLFLPFAYFYALYMHYEMLFVRLQFSLKDNITLRKYAKRRILLSVNISLRKLKRITPGFLFSQCKNKSDIRLEIKEKLSGKLSEPEYLY